MKIEDPLAYSFFMPDELYLLSNDKVVFDNIIASPQPVTKEKVLPVNYSYLGGHQKKFLIVVHYPEHDFIADRHFIALQSILNRLKFTVEDVAIFNRAKHPDAEFAALLNFFKPEKLLLLGKESLPAGIETPELNKIKKLTDFPLLFSYSFEDMMDNQVNKKLFWDQIKLL